MPLQELKLGVDYNIENDYCFHMQTEKFKPDPQPPKDLGRVSSESLLGAKRELLIAHNGREYRLRITQNGKLILTA